MPRKVVSTVEEAIADLLHRPATWPWLKGVLQNALADGRDPEGAARDVRRLRRTMTTADVGSGFVLPDDSCCRSVPQLTRSASERAAVLSVRALFVVVLALLVADLHSSWVASPATWESNPVVDAMGEAIGKHAALAAVKCADVFSLYVLHVLWKRSRAHAVTACVLAIVAVQYAATVFNNYLG